MSSPIINDHEALKEKKRGTRMNKVMDNMDKWREWLIVIAVAGGLGWGGSSFKDYVDPPRPDPFTGTEARAMYKELSEAQARCRLELEKRIDELDDEGTRGLKLIEARVSRIESQFNQMNVRLDAILGNVTEMKIMLARIEERERYHSIIEKGLSANDKKNGGMK